MTEIQKKLYTASDLQSRYAIMSVSGQGVTRQTLYRWRKEKGFPQPRVSSPSLLWLKDDVHEWESNNDLGWLQDEVTKH